MLMKRKLYHRVYDVLVAGGGVSGCAAALAAARNGAEVLLLEQRGYLGAVSYTHLDVYKRQLQRPVMPHRENVSYS